MKQSHHLAGLGINAREVCSFVEVAVMARQGQVFGNVRAFVLTSNNVFDVECQRFLRLEQAAIFAASVCPMPDRLAQPRVHQDTPARARRRLALA